MVVRTPTLSEARSKADTTGLLLLLPDYLPSRTFFPRLKRGSRGLEFLVASPAFFSSPLFLPSFHVIYLSFENGRAYSWLKIRRLPLLSLPPFILPFFCFVFVRSEQQ